ncbi:MAG TPA: hypothetical protein VJI15_02470 [Candidatus Nanoarchaeia archaeon]|nr:hypothetical protein [Candidatus Nanoarchaeia archaeon]
MNDTDNGLKEGFHQKKREVAQLRSTLHDLYVQKEASFQKLKAFREQIRSKIDQMNSLKKERDLLTQEVKAIKEERNKLNQEVREKSDALKQFGTNNPLPAPSSDRKNDNSHNKNYDGRNKNYNTANSQQMPPGKIKMLIRKMEEQLETEVMSFDKEKQLTKKVKELKAEYKKIEAQDQQWKERQTAASGFIQKRKEAQHSHHSLQEKADASQQKHQEVNKVYEDLKAIRNQIKPLETEHLRLKEEYHAVKRQLGDAQQDIQKLSRVFEDKEKKIKQSFAQERTAEVKEKIKKRQKLSTEDILAFQAIPDED